MVEDGEAGVEVCEGRDGAGLGSGGAGAGFRPADVERPREQCRESVMTSTFIYSLLVKRKYHHRHEVLLSSEQVWTVYPPSNTSRGEFLRAEP